jgi:hypothetical protein
MKIGMQSNNKNKEGNTQRIERSRRKEIHRDKETNKKSKKYGHKKDKERRGKGFVCTIA